MATVDIDIPGIGLVEAKNAASESTLRELVNLMSGGKGGGKKDKDPDTKKTTTLFNRLGMGVGQTIGAFNVLNKNIATTIKSLADVGDSLESAAALFSGIPLIGPALGATAAAATSVAQSFTDAAGSGASFGGSMLNFSRAAGQAGMTMEQFGSFVRANGAAMVAFGGTTEGGAKRFGQLSKEIRATGADLYALGFNTRDINEGLATYGKQLRLQGLNSGRSNKELAAGAKNYLKEMDGLAKITGLTRKEKEAERVGLLKDAQFQASMAGLQKDVRDSFLNTVQGLPAGMQAFTKDILATGTATTAENAKLMSQMPKSAAMLQTMREKMQRGEAVSIEERNALNNMMKQEGSASLANIKNAGAASSELAPLVNSLASTMEIQTDGIKQMTAEQKKAAEETDKMNKKIQESQQRLAEITNKFKMVLVNSGVLDMIMASFETLSSLVSMIIVPAFQILGAVVGGIAGLINTFVLPALNVMGAIITDTLYPAFLDLAVFFQENILPVLEYLGGILTDYVIPPLAWLGEKLLDVGSLIGEYLSPILLGVVGGLAAYKIALFAKTAATWLANGGLLATAAATWALVSPLLLAAAPFIAIGVAIGAAIALFKGLYDAGWTLGSAFEAVKDNFARFGLYMSEVINDIRRKLPNWAGGISGEEADMRKEEIEKERTALNEREKLRDAKREEVKKDRGTDEVTKQTKRDEMNLKLKRSLGIGYQKQTAEDQKALDARKKLNADYSTPEGSLASFLAKNNSSLIKDRTAGTPSSSTVQTALTEKEAKAKAEADAKSAKEAKSKGEDPKTGEKTPSKPTMTEGEFWANLNTSIQSLVRLQSQQLMTNNRQLAEIEALRQDMV